MIREIQARIRGASLTASSRNNQTVTSTLDCPGRKTQKEVNPHTAAHIVYQLARAMAHAHENEILHRDIKPGNVLLCPKPGERCDSDFGFIPILTDFGLAKIQGGNLAPTHTGTIMGTFDYMSPEQAAGKSELVGKPSDIYALGALIYFLVWGVPPLRGTNDLQTIEKIIHDRPPPIAASYTKFHSDLDVICQKCLAKLPEDRYASSAELADDLERYLNGEPIKARPISTVTRIFKWTRRYPGWSSLVMISVLSLVSLIAGTMYFRACMTAQMEARASDQQMAREFESEIRRRAYISDLQKINRTKSSANIERDIKLLSTYVPAKDEPDLRDFTWWLNWRELTQSKVIGTHPKGEIAVAITRDGALAASGGVEGAIRLWHVRTGELVSELLDAVVSPIDSLDFSPDGQLLVSSANSGRIVCWSVTAKHQLWSCHTQGCRAYQARFSPAGDVIASAHGDHHIRLWNPENGEQMGTLAGHQDEVRSLAFHPHESVIASGSTDGTIRIWDWKQRSPDARLDCGPIQARNRESWPRTVVFEPDGKHLLVVTAGAEFIKIAWQTDRFGKEVDQRYEGIIARSVLCARDGSVIAGWGTGDISIQKGISKIGREMPLIGHTDALSSLAMSIDESVLVSGAKDGTVRLWPGFLLRSRLPLAVRPDHEAIDDSQLRHSSMQWGGECLATDYPSGKVSIYSMLEKRLVAIVDKSPTDRFVLSPLGRFVLIHKSTGEISVVRVCEDRTEWNCTLSSNSRTDDFYPRPVFNQTEEMLAIPIGKEVQLISMYDGHVIQTLQHPAITNEVLFRESSSGQLEVISACEDGCIRFWDCKSGEEKKTHRTHSRNVQTLALSPSQQSLATVGCGSYECSLRIWRLDDMSESRTTNMVAELRQAQFLSETLMVFQVGQVVSGWSITDEAELFTFLPTQYPAPFAVSPDRHQLAIARDTYFQILDGTPEAPSSPSK